jgi:hypothetical protein
MQAFFEEFLKIMTTRTRGQNAPLRRRISAGTFLVKLLKKCVKILSIFVSIELDALN